MPVYINGMATISPQNTFGDIPFLDSIIENTNNRLAAVEPDYVGMIDAKSLRRMSRIIRMGMACAYGALKEADVVKPSAIITGTSYGCIEDTSIFLRKLIENKEEALSPTPFIHSTHNTIGSQVALMTQCHGYNQTYSQRAFSFEHALLDGMMHIEDDENNILVSAAEETTDVSFYILNRFNLVRKENASNLTLLDNGNGTIIGEGASSFLLSGLRTEKTYCEIKDVVTLYSPDGEDGVMSSLYDLMKRHSLKAGDIDFVLAGKNGVWDSDIHYDNILNRYFKDIPVGAYKHLTGEFPTANAFALWLGAKILKEGVVPAVVNGEVGNKFLQRILLYNRYLGLHHSFILIER